MGGKPQPDIFVGKIFVIPIPCDMPLIVIMINYEVGDKLRKVKTSFHLSTRYFLMFSGVFLPRDRMLSCPSKGLDGSV